MYFPSAFDGSDRGVSSFPSAIAFEYTYELLRRCNVSLAPTLPDWMCQDIKWHNSLSFKLLHQAYIDDWTRFVLAVDLVFGQAGETARHIPLDYDRSLDSEGIVRTELPRGPASAILLPLHPPWIRRLGLNLPRILSGLLVLYAKLGAPFSTHGSGYADATLSGRSLHFLP